MKIIGIYQIKNLINGHCYVGSSNNIKKRWTTHKRLLENGTHHSVYLQRAWNKYGPKSFEFSIIEEISDESELFKYEKLWSEKLLPQYSIGSIGGGDNISNHPNLDKIKQKHSDNLKQRFENMSHDEYQSWTSRYGENNPNWKGGSSHPICPKCKLHHMSPQSLSCSKCRDRNKNNNPFFGQHHSDSTKEKLKERMIGQKPTNSHKVKIEGIIYESKADAAKALGVSNGLISYRFKKNYPNYEIIQ